VTASTNGMIIWQQHSINSSIFLATAFYQ